MTVGLVILTIKERPVTGAKTADLPSMNPPSVFTPNKSNATPRSRPANF